MSKVVSRAALILVLIAFLLFATGILTVTSTTHLTGPLDRNFNPVAVKYLEGASDQEIVNAYKQTRSKDDAIRIDGRPLLSVAISEDRRELAKKLIQIRVDANTGEGTRRPLARAVMAEDTEMCVLFLSHGADPSVEMYPDRSILDMARLINSELHATMLSKIEELNQSTPKETTE